MHSILNYLKVYFYYIYYIISFLCNKKGTSKNVISGKCLINKPEGSYRIYGSEHTDYFIIFKYAYRLILKWNAATYKPYFEQNNSLALYDETADFEPRLLFIESVYKTRPGLFINKEQISNCKNTTSVNVVKCGILLICLFPFLLFSFSKNRAQVALVLHEVDELAQLLAILKNNKIKTVIYSCIFEKDSNAAANLLIQNGYIIIKNPSEDPLYFNNQMIIANELAICNPYQLSEVEAFKQTIQINKTLNWYPENHLIHLKGKVFTEPETGIVGYYSGSSWLRIALNYNLVKAAFDPYKAEAECEQFVASFIAQNPTYKVRVFLHPLEKKHESLTKNHFKQVWPNIPYEFENFALHTTDTFNRCDVAVTVFSGVMYYRYYAGYKGLLYCPYMPNFPIPNSVLDAVSAKTQTEFNHKLLQFLACTNVQFKKEILLNKYTYS